MAYVTNWLLFRERNVNAEQKVAKERNTENILFKNCFTLNHHSFQLATFLR